MGVILLIVGLIIFVYVMGIHPMMVNSAILGRLLAGDNLPNGIEFDTLMEILKTADWIKNQEELRPVEDSTDGTHSADVVCKGVTYRLNIHPSEDGTAKMLVSVITSREPDGLERVRRTQEANRIRCYVMERLDPRFTEQAQDFYGKIKNMYFLRYCVASILGVFFCFAAAPDISERILGSRFGPYVAIVFCGIALFFLFAYTVPLYITASRKEKLLDGIHLSEYLDNNALMTLLQSQLHIKFKKDIYFDERGIVTIKGKSGTHFVWVSSGVPKLFVQTKKDDYATACQEADYLRCSIIKLFQPSYPENPSKLYHTLTVLRRGTALAITALLACILFFAVPFLLNRYNSRGIANSYFTQYSTTVTIGDAFKAFFENPQWKRYKSNGNDYVNFTGSCEVFGQPAVMVITFQHFEDRFWIEGIDVNGVEMDKLLLPAIMSTIYSNSKLEEETLQNDTQERNSNPSLNDDTPVQAESNEGAFYENPGIYDDFIGSWQDQDGNGNYLFIGYGDSEKQQVYAYVAMPREFEVELTGWDGTTASGTAMGQGSEPIYVLEISRMKYWLDVGIYASEDDSYESLTFVPADPETCPYENPYYVG